MNRSANAINALAVTLLVLAGCGEKQRGVEDTLGTGGDPKQGQVAIRRFGCGACHVIPRVPGANGIVGPPLGKMAERGYLAGRLANTPENMIRWLLDPPEVKPSTAMPNVGLSKANARDIAAYLYTRK